MIKYNQNHRKYVGDTNMRPDTQQNQVSRYKRKDDASTKRGRSLAEEVQLSNFAKKLKEAKYHQGANSRLCENLV